MVLGQFLREATLTIGRSDARLQLVGSVDDDDAVVEDTAHASSFVYQETRSVGIEKHRL